MNKRILATALTVIALCSALPALAELKLPRVSQRATVSQTIGLTEVTIVYSRPGVKGRTIWGALVPWDQVWRSGANEATMFTVSDDVLVNGQKLPAGSYSLHTIPGRESWTIILNKVADQWGSYSYDVAKDALRVTVKPEAAPFEEWLTYSFPDVSMSSANVNLRWEKVRVPFRIEVDTAAKATAASRAAVSSAKADDWKTPFSAARFAFEQEMSNTDEQMQWMTQSLKAEENPTNLGLKAQMLARAGKKKDAIATAEKAIAIAGKSEKKIDTTQLEKMLAEWKSKK
ncbi:MAG TPA: DUF2911 domain-containing protein [Thermoanaerobaculia bacterium]|nr:DUF2911 domain-containing protein [Thermoanaerobaculia bacterium]